MDCAMAPGNQQNVLGDGIPQSAGDGSAVADVFTNVSLPATPIALFYRPRHDCGMLIPAFLLDKLPPVLSGNTSALATRRHADLGR